MAEGTIGRPSKKRQRIYNIYRLLRCAMTSDDIKELLNRNPVFCERTLDDTDVNIVQAIYDMTEAMIALYPPDLSRAEPLRR